MTNYEEAFRQGAKAGAGGVCDLVDLIIAEGLRRGASDIHVEPGVERLLVRFRLDGVLHPPVTAETKLALNVIARIKVLAELLTYQTDVPQEGRIDRAKVNAPSDLRVSTFPTVHGEKAVLRLFDRDAETLQLADLGYPKPILQELQRQLHMPTGVMFLTGPAGSGKTTTIYAALKYILQTTSAARNIVTVEDPVERILEGVTQTEVRPAAGLTFARCLRSLMRQDPEVIVIGEVRDEETAGIAIEAGLTGHLVISTIHSGTAPGVFTRLLEMGVAPYLVASSVNFVVAQRLMRKLCDACKRLLEHEEGCSAEFRKLLDQAYEPVGCDSCFGAGYSGRIVIAETVKTEKRMRSAILEQAEKERLAQIARELGMAPLPLAAFDEVAKGATSPAEVQRVLGPEAAESALRWKNKNGD